MAFYTYWEGVDCRGGELYGLPGRAAGGVATNDGLTMTYVTWPVAEFERFRGSPDLPNFLRKPDGAGWALVGDAGRARVTPAGRVTPRGPGDPPGPGDPRDSGALISIRSRFDYGWSIS